MRKVNLAELLKERRKLRIIMLLAGIVAFVGFFFTVGFVGHFDYVDEMHLTMTAEEEAATWGGAYVSVAVFCLSMGIYAATSKHEERVDRRIKKIRYERHKKLKQMEIAKVINDYRANPAVHCGSRPEIRKVI